MRYFLLILIFISLANCTNQVSNFNDNELDIDIYNTEMTFDKFKKTVIDYADKASYPSLINND
tara:strand:- start:1901 stop:2089 length:189 start_codon:yes stop_codon:yes gene_type:complete